MHVFGPSPKSLIGQAAVSASGFRELRNAFAFGAAGEVNEAATVAAVRPELQAGALDDNKSFLLRSVGSLLQTDAQSGSHPITLASVMASNTKPHRWNLQLSLVVLCPSIRPQSLGLAHGLGRGA